MSDLVSLSKISLTRGTFTQVRKPPLLHLISYPDPVRTAHPNATKVERMRSGRARNIRKQSRADHSTKRQQQAKEITSAAAGISTGIERRHHKRAIYACSIHASIRNNESGHRGRPNPTRKPPQVPPHSSQPLTPPMPMQCNATGERWRGGTIEMGTLIGIRSREWPAHSLDST